MTESATPRTTDSLGRPLDEQHTSVGIQWWEAEVDFHTPFPRDPGRPLDDANECLSRSGATEMRWYCTRQPGHPTPHRASVGHDAITDYCVAEWWDQPGEAGRRNFIDAINAGMRRDDDFGAQVRAAVTRVTGSEGPIT